MPEPIDDLIAKVRSLQLPWLTNQTSAKATTQPMTLKPTEELTIQIALEHLRQARYSFNLSLVIVGVGAVVSFAGAGLLMSGKTTVGAVTAAGSLVSSVCHLQLMREANDRLEKSAAILKDNDRTKP